MTKSELILKLNSECHTGDDEGDHRLADKLLLEYIGDSDVDAAYDSIDKWYA